MFRLTLVRLSKYLIAIVSLARQSFVILACTAHATSNAAAMVNAAHTASGIRMKALTKSEQGTRNIVVTNKAFQ